MKARNPFRRPGLRYGETPEPVTPYQRAARAWDEREGAKRAQIRDWRRAFLGTLAITAIVAGDNVRLRLSSSIVPWIVQVDRIGEPTVVGPADATYVPTDAMLAYQLGGRGGFIESVRSLSIDPVVVRRNWMHAYDMVTDRGGTALNNLARERDPFGKIGRESVSVEMTSVVRASDHSFRVAWIERRTIDGAALPEERWSAILTIALQPPRDAERLRRNPLGVYVDGIAWAKETA